MGYDEINDEAEKRLARRRSVQNMGVAKEVEVAIEVEAAKEMAIADKCCNQSMENRWRLTKWESGRYQAFRNRGMSTWFRL